MKYNIFKGINIALICFSLLSVMFVVSCEETDEEGVELYSFGPSPVLRGNDIKFLGQNLNEITSIILPEAIEITEITRVSNSEISITIPQDAKTGHIILNYKDGSITSKSRLGFTEPYSISSLSPTDIAVREGEEVTISGDYLNNIVKVTFQTAAAVDSADFMSQSREELIVKVPKEALSGKIIVEDINGNQLYSDDELTISQPTLTSLSPSAIKAGQNLTLSGTNLDLISNITFSGGSIVNVEDFVSATTTQIVVTTPENIKDGTITLTAYSGVEIISTESLTTTVPGNISVSAETRFKNGLNITISGDDLDLVSSILLTGAASAITEFTVANGKITVAIPADATDGVITLATKAEKTVESDPIVLVEAEVTTVDPMSVTATFDISITGVDLDLVSSVIFAGDHTGEITASNETSLTVTVPAAAESGELSLVQINGATIATGIDLTVIPNNIPVVSSITAQVKPGALLTIEGEKLNLVETVIFQDDVKATSFGSRTASLIEVYVPESAKGGSVTVKLVTYDAQEVLSPAFNIAGTDPIIASTIIVMDYEPHGGHDGTWDAAWDGNSEILTEDGNTFIRFNANANGWLLNCNHQADGAPAPIIENIENYVLKLDVRIEDGVSGAENAELQFVFADAWNYWYGANLLPATTGGEWVTISVPTSQWALTGTFDLSSGTNGLYGGIVPAGVSIDNLRFDLK